MSDLETFNRALFLYINGGEGTPTWLVQTAVGIANDLIYLVPALLLGLWFWSGHAGRNLAIKACLIAMLGVAANQAIGAVWPHPRPFMIGLGHAWMPHAADSSFPSDHMTLFVGIGLTLLLDGAAGWGAITLLMGLCVAWARVFLGVHFPLDMLGAVGVAVCSYLITTPLWHRAGMATTRLAEKLYRTVFARPISAGWIRR